MTDNLPAPASPAQSDPARASRLMQALIGLAVLLGFLAVFLGAFLTHDQALKHDLALVLIAAVYTVLNFFFGSSAGSKSKDSRRDHG